VRQRQVGATSNGYGSAPVPAVTVHALARPAPARTVACLRRDDIPELLRAIDLFERCGLWSPGEAGTWRIVARAVLAERS